MVIFDDIFGRQFSGSNLNVSIFRYCQISLHYAKYCEYCSTQISKVIGNYRQISSRSMTCSIVIHVIKYVVSERKTKIRKTSFLRAFSFQA